VKLEAGLLAGVLALAGCVDKTAMEEFKREALAWGQNEPERYTYRVEITCGGTHCLEGTFRVRAGKDSVLSADHIETGTVKPVGTAMQDLGIEQIMVFIYSGIQAGDPAKVVYDPQYHFPAHAVVDFKHGGGWKLEVKISDFLSQ
jgi:hypothetical protein